MEVSGQHHALTALLSENNIRLPFNTALGESHSRSGHSEMRKSLVPAGNRTMIP